MACRTVRAGPPQSGRQVHRAKGYVRDEATTHRGSVIWSEHSWNSDQARSRRPHRQHGGARRALPAVRRKQTRRRGDERRHPPVRQRRDRSARERTSGLDPRRRAHRRYRRDASPACGAPRCRPGQWSGQALPGVGHWGPSRRSRPARRARCHCGRRTTTAARAPQRTTRWHDQGHRNSVAVPRTRRLFAATSSAVASR